MSTITLNDGRLVEVTVSGPENGFPLIYHSMTPGAGLAPRGIEREAHARGLRVVSYARPGYGGSSRAPGRSVADAANDTEEIMDRLGLSQTVMVGLSGGGPHALAAAQAMPERVAAVLTIAGVGPSDQPDLDFQAGRGEASRQQWELAFAGEGALRPALESMAAALGAAGRDVLGEAVRSMLSPADQSAFEGELGEDMIDAFQGGLASGIDGWLDDLLAFSRPWGFTPKDIRVPVFVWQGDEDLLVPGPHGQWLAKHIPGAIFGFRPNEGHVSVLKHTERMFDELTSVL
ncbi:alpha/beta hydrolase [Streptomyces sp. J2-1]|uniref:alpha/beta fold hydrolase n=1 Tax=Streptomyces corallincola TaxID=2851888 RepID=UPI001C393067|nr:alpha/beta hydrolase [Streptomyces corallincola]MBV2354180.1 alpha/beta hydrolase [Streptomyces corallincola]